MPSPQRLSWAPLETPAPNQRDPAPVSDHEADLDRQDVGRTVAPVTVLCVVDFSLNGTRSLDAALTWISRMSSPCMLHVLALVPKRRKLWGRGPRTLEEALVRVKGQIEDEIAKRVQLGTMRFPETLIARACAGAERAEAAKIARMVHADLLVVNGRTGLAGIHGLGGADRIGQRAPCTLLVVHHAQDPEPGNVEPIIEERAAILNTAALPGSA